ncbi:MAG: peptidyl-prolyl cis-trans isomerase [Acidobacteria bacterium]|nr:peptidyl-prolyl cis-trans isomerase [Acidobacteriota bacterium]
MRRSRFLILPVVLLAGLFSAPAGAAVIEEIVAKVNNRIITKSEFEERGQAMVRQMYQQYFGEDLDREMQIAQDGLLANLITENLLLERAETIFDIDRIRANLVSDFREQQNITNDEQLAELLKEQEMTRRDLEDHLIRIAVPQEILNYDVRRKISVSEREIRQYYDEHYEEWETGEKVTFRELVLFYEPSMRFDVEGRMDAIEAELEGGADFVELVRRYSEAGTRENDGLIGPLHRKDLHPALAGGAFSVGVGGISEVIDTGRSLHLIRVEKRTPRHVMPIDEARDDIQDAVRRSKFAPRYDRYLRKLWKENQIEVMPKYEKYLVYTPLTQAPDS